MFGMDFWVLAAFASLVWSTIWAIVVLIKRGLR